jgi:hypothetical protein
MRAALLCSLLLSAACGDASTTPLTQLATTRAPGALRLESPTLAIELSPQLTPDDRGDAVPFVLAGWTNAAGALSMALSGRVAAIPVEGGGFAVSLDDAQLGAALAGEPLVLTLEPPGQPVHTVSIHLAPRFLRVTGDAPITLEPWVEPRAGRFEGEVRAAARVASLMIQTDDDSDPEVERATEQRWRFAWSLPSLKLAAWPSTDPVYFYARDPQGAMLGTSRAELGVVVRAATLSIAPR